MSESPQTLSDIVVPENFTPYIRVLTEEKTRIIESGALSVSEILNNFLAGGGNTINVPGLSDLEAGDTTATGLDRVSGALGTNHYSLNTSAGNVQVGAGTGLLDPLPQKIEDTQEVAIRLSRNNSWTSNDLAAALAGTDPMDAIATSVSRYWMRRLQKTFIATWTGVFADNDANNSGDYSFDASGASFQAGVTNFTAEAVIDAANTMGDSSEDLTTLVVHSNVMARMKKNNLIDYIPDSVGITRIPTFLGYQVVVDDAMPVTGSIYESWLFAGGSTMLGMGAPKVPTEVQRLPGAANGGGQEVLYSRVEWAIHPTGHAWTGATTADGGPSQATIAAAGSWSRVYPERKQIKAARLITREA